MITIYVSMTTSSYVKHHLMCEVQLFGWVEHNFGRAASLTVTYVVFPADGYIKASGVVSCKQCYIATILTSKSVSGQEMENDNRYWWS